MTDTTLSLRSTLPARTLDRFIRVQAASNPDASDYRNRRDEAGQNRLHRRLIGPGHRIGRQQRKHRDQEKVGSQHLAFVPHKDRRAGPAPRLLHAQ